MKTIVIIAVGVVLIAGTAFVTAPRADESMVALAATNTVLADISAKTEAATAAGKIEFAQRHLNEMDFTIYKMCHSAEPTTKAHKQMCAQVAKKLVAAEAKSEAYKW